jgi:uncharacterized DUF497 family protein
VEIKAGATVGAAERVDISRHLDNMHECTYNFMMKLDWDPAKAASNQRKHKVDFADAVSVLDDDRAVTIRECVSGEERFVTLGMNALGRLLVVVYAWRGDSIRIISARRATPHESHQYEG